MELDYAQGIQGLVAGGGARYVDGTETLRLTVFNAASGVTCQLVGRVLVDGDRIVPFSHPLIPTTNRAATIFDLPLPPGWLLAAAVRVAAGAPVDGQTYAVLSLGYGAGAQFTELELLAAGSVTAGKRIGFPGGALLGPLDGPGAIRSVTGSDPAAGAEINDTVPTGARWELICATVTFVTDATVATRNPALLLDDGATNFYRGSISIVITASLTAIITWGQASALALSVTNGLPSGNVPVNNRLLAGHRIRSATAAIQAGDNYGAPQYLLREWIEGA